nr:hypothetical protein CFP56_03952 [Quercus suber]
MVIKDVLGSRNRLLIRNSKVRRIIAKTYNCEYAMLRQYSGRQAMFACSRLPYLSAIPDRFCTLEYSKTRAYLSVRRCEVQSQWRSPALFFKHKRHIAALAR